ncbi:MAG TPA: hypothetical protein VEX41_03490 [Candidatus Eisenbacteria bacterium]|nr:hypothetical protein [Candidatus Eisenbacteria bacterium]
MTRRAYLLRDHLPDDLAILDRASARGAHASRTAAPVLPSLVPHGGLAALARSDGGSRHEAVMALQRTVGNRAVLDALADGPAKPSAVPATSRQPAHGPEPQATSLSSIAAVAAGRPGFAVIGSPAATAMPAPGGIAEIKGQPGGATAAGYTRLPATTPVVLEIGRPQKRGGGWVALPSRVRVDQEPPFALYPGPGVHDLPETEGRRRHGYVSDEVSGVIRAGEEEHLADLEWARHLTYDTVVAAINGLTAGGAAVADSPDIATQATRDAVRSALPPQLRWPDGIEPDKRWRDAYASLVGVTRGRDKAGWHFVPAETIRIPAEEEKLKKQLGVPAEDELRRYTDRSEIGSHDSEAIVPAAFDAL